MVIAVSLAGMPGARLCSLGATQCNMLSHDGRGGWGGVFSMSGPPCFGPRTSDVF